MLSANRFSALESDDENEVPQVPVKKQSNEKKNEKKQQAPVQEQEKKPKNVNKNEGVEMEYKKQDSRRGTSDKANKNRDTYAPRQGKRQFERRDGTGRAHKDSKKEGAGQHNWGNEVEEELNTVNKVEEIDQVPVSEQPYIEKSEHIGKGIEETAETTEETPEEKTPAAPEEKKLTLEEFRKQQKEARKNYQNKELFSARQERTADVIENAEVVKISLSEEDDLIKASTSSKPKKKKVQRSQKTVVVEKEVIGFSPNARRVPRTDKPKVSENHKPEKREGNEQSAPTARRDRGEYGSFKGARGRGDFKENGRGGFKKSINIDDMKSFPVLKV